MKKIVLLSLFFLPGFICSMGQNEKAEEPLVSKIDSKLLDRLNKLTAYKRDLYLERLVEKGIVSLDQIEAIHHEIKDGLEYHEDRMDKDLGGGEARWESAVDIAPENIKKFIEKRKKAGSDARSCMVFLFGKYGVGKETLAYGIAHVLRLKKMVVPAHQLLDETQLGTELRVRDLMIDFSSRKNTALILSNIDCLLARKNKYTLPENILSTLRQPNRTVYAHKYLSNLVICTGEEPRLYPKYFPQEVYVSAHMDKPNSDQRIEAARVMFADKGAEFEPGAEEYLKKHLATKEDVSYTDLQKMVHTIHGDAYIAHQLKDRSSARINTADIDHGLYIIGLKD